MFCHKCGARIPEDSLFCPKCGVSVPQLHAPATFMSGPAGRSVENPMGAPSRPYGQNNADNNPRLMLKETVFSSFSRAKAAIGSKSSDSLKIGLIAVGIILLVAVILLAQPSSLNKAMNECKSQVDSEQWSDEVGEDGYFQLADHGHTLTVSGLDNYDDEILSCVFSELNTPQSVQSKILHTRALDGTLTDSWGRITITWNFQPSEGLDIIFEEK
ncbi:zinc ribbon domain-containing protein [Bifidobacterium simiarum]|nr:zinc ribbon domain-containing protein [Bifidobacterium simiarum]